MAIINQYQHHIQRGLIQTDKFYNLEEEKVRLLFHAPEEERRDAATLKWQSSSDFLDFKHISRMHCTHPIINTFYTNHTCIFILEAVLRWSILHIGS